MTSSGLIQCGLYLLTLGMCAKPLGHFMAGIYEGRIPGILGLLRPLERQIYRASAIAPEAEMGWRRYATALLSFSLVSILVVYALQRVQASCR